MSDVMLDFFCKPCTIDQETRKTSAYLDNARVVLENLLDKRYHKHTYCETVVNGLVISKLLFSDVFIWGNPNELLTITDNFRNTFAVLSRGSIMEIKQHPILGTYAELTDTVLIPDVSYRIYFNALGEDLNFTAFNKEGKPELEVLSVYSENGDSDDCDDSTTIILEVGTLKDAKPTGYSLFCYTHLDRPGSNDPDTPYFNLKLLDGQEFKFTAYRRAHPVILDYIESVTDKDGEVIHAKEPSFSLLAWPKGSSFESYSDHLKITPVFCPETYKDVTRIVIANHWVSDLIFIRSRKWTDGLYKKEILPVYPVSESCYGYYLNCTFKDAKAKIKDKRVRDIVFGEEKESEQLPQPEAIVEKPVQEVEVKRQERPKSFWSRLKSLLTDTEK